jgi:hypothetical protein
MSAPFDSQFNGAEYDEAILKVRTTLLVGEIPLAVGSLAVPSLRFSAEPTTGWYRNSAGDVRMAILGADFAVWKAITATGVANGPALGLGMIPLRAGLNVLAPNSAVSGAGVQLYNTDPTDGNATGVAFRAITTGGGGAAFTEMGKVSCLFTTHAAATMTSQLFFLWYNLGAVQGIRFTGVNTITSDTGALSLASGSGNGNINLLPNGTGKIVFGLGNLLRFTSGANQVAGETTLVGGTKTIANTVVSATTVIMLSRKTAGGTLGFLTYTLNAGVGFTINSSSATDTSVIEYILYDVS